MISDLILVFSLFWIYFYARHESVVKSDSFACSCPVFLTPFVEEAVFSALYIVPSFVINKLPIGFISGLSILFHWVSGGVGDVIQLTQWTRVWVSSRNWWWGGRPGVLQSMGSQRVRHDWVTELNWSCSIELRVCFCACAILFWWTQIWGSGTWIPLLFGDYLCSCSYPPICGLTTWVRYLDYTVSLLLLPISLWLFLFLF